MKLRWNLDNIYSSFDSEEYKSDMQKCDQMIARMDEWIKENLQSKEDAVIKIEEYLLLKSEMMSLLEKLMCYAFLIMNVDAQDAEASGHWARMQNKESEVTASHVKFQKWLGSLEDLDQMISKSMVLEQHRFYLFEQVKKVQYLLSDEEEILISKMANTGWKAWNQLQSKLTSGMTVELMVDGEEKSYSLGGVWHLVDDHPECADEIYQAKVKAYEKVAVPVAACLNGIKGEVLTICQHKRYLSPLEKSLQDFRIQESTVKAMFSVIEKSMPHFKDYYRKKAELLGFEHNLPMYARYRQVAENKIKFTFAEARDYIVNNFRSYSDSLADFAEKVFAEQWIDAEPREGKAHYGFCINFHPIKESRIMYNFNGTFSDVAGLAHEIGHAYQFSCLAHQVPFLNREYTPPVSETASIFAETIVQNAAIQNAGEEVKLAILDMAIAKHSALIFQSYIDFTFEFKLFEHRKNYSLSVDELRNLYREVVSETYGDSIDSKYIDGYSWIINPLYYWADSNFYNFTYAFGLLFSKGIYAEYQKQGDAFVEKFDQMLAATGKKSVEDLALMLGLDLASGEFWENSLRLLKEEIELFLQLVD